MAPSTIYTASLEKVINILIFFVITIIYLHLNRSLTLFMPCFLCLLIGCKIFWDRKISQENIRTRMKNCQLQYRLSQQTKMGQIKLAEHRKSFKNFVGECKGYLVEMRTIVDSFQQDSGNTAVVNNNPGKTTKGKSSNKSSRFGKAYSGNNQQNPVYVSFQDSESQVNKLSYGHVKQATGMDKLTDDILDICKIKPCNPKYCQDNSNKEK